MKNSNTPRLKDSITFLERHSHFYLIPIILLISYMLAMRVSDDLALKSNTLKIGTSYPSKSIEYPYLTNVADLYVNAEAAIITDLKTNTIVYEKNKDIRFSMASTTKVMTALVGLEHYKDDTVLVSRRTDVEGVNVGLKIGDQLYFKDALYALMLPSGNDVAYLIADNYPGGTASFIRAMNKKANDLKLLNTHYADPAGLNDDGNYTTAYELSQLASIAKSNPTLSKVMGTKSYTASDVKRMHIFKVSNLNQFLGMYGVVGGKTGYTEGAQGVLMTLATIKGRDYAVIVMRSSDRFLDTSILLSPLQNNIAIFYPR